MRSRSPYPPAVHAQALELYASHGGREASKQTGVPQPTIRSWVKRASDQANAAARAVGLVEIVGGPGVAVPWSQRREPFIAGLGVTVVLAHEQLNKALIEGRARDSREFMVAVGIMLDKLELLSGNATRRTESYSIRAAADLDAMRAEIVQNERKLAELKAGAE